MSREADVVVIGGGPGGYVCAIRAAQLGLKTILVERDQLGGICVAYGCIPSKALISMVKLYEKAKEGATFGIVADGIRVDLPALQKWKAGVVSTLETGVATLCRGNKVEVIEGKRRGHRRKEGQGHDQLGNRGGQDEEPGDRHGVASNLAARPGVRREDSSSAPRRRSRSKAYPRASWSWEGDTSA